MLDDILDFASGTLVDDGRLSFWMPSANDEEQEIPIPTHPCLSVVVVCSQVFNKCRLTYYMSTFSVGVFRLCEKKSRAKTNRDMIRREFRFYLRNSE